MSSGLRNAVDQIKAAIDRHGRRARPSGLDCVIADRVDFDYAADVAGRFKLWECTAAVLFSPVHGELDPATLAGWILEARLPVRLQIQAHKYIWSPEARGV